MKFSELLVAIDNTPEPPLAIDPESDAARKDWENSLGAGFVTKYSDGRCARGSWFGREVLNRYSLEEIDAMYARFKIEQGDT